MGLGFTGLGFRFKFKVSGFEDDTGDVLRNSRAEF